MRSQLPVSDPSPRRPHGVPRKEGPVRREEQGQGHTRTVQDGRAVSSNHTAGTHRTHQDMEVRLLEHCGRFCLEPLILRDEGFDL